MELSPLIATCEKIWKRLQEYNSDIPDVVIVIGSGGRRATTLLGHFAKNSWGGEGGPEDTVHEVLLVAENLKRSAEEVFTTLIHEAAHGIAESRGIKDVSGVRHNRKFAMVCEELGMMPPENPDSRLGFSAATLTPALEEHFAEEIGWLEAELTFFRKLFLKEKTTNKTTWIASCLCDRKVRLPKKTINDPRALDLVCQECGSDFNMSDEEIDSFEDMARS